MDIKSVCIVGPGAIGGMMAVFLERAGYQVSALARPSRAAAITRRGIVLEDKGEIFTGHPKVATTAKDIGPQDLVVVTLKDAGLRELAADLPALCKPTTQILFVMNGVPWWFLDGFKGPGGGKQLTAVDPDGFLARTIDKERLIWGVIDCGVSEKPDGTLLHTFNYYLQIGRPDGDLRDLADIAGVFVKAGYDCQPRATIRDAIWAKLVGNITMNPVSAITMGTLDKIFGDPIVVDLLIDVAHETRGLAQKLGIDPGADPVERMRSAASRLGPVRTSMLQDAQRGRPLELSSIMGSVLEIGEIVGHAMPMTRIVYGLARVRSLNSAAQVAS